MLSFISAGSLRVNKTFNMRLDAKCLCCTRTHLSDTEKAANLYLDYKQS